MTTDYHRAAARRALEPLVQDADFTHSSTLLKRTFGDEVYEEIKQAERDAREFNKQAKESGGSQLTDEAAVYWLEVQQLIERGKAAQTLGDQISVDEVNRASESLMARFEEMVPQHDKAKFKAIIYLANTDGLRHKAPIRSQANVRPFQTLFPR